MLPAQHRERQLALRAATLVDLLALWKAVNPENLSSTINPFALAAATIVQARFRDSGVLASRFYRVFRESEGVAGTVAVVAPPPPARDAVAGLLRGAALSGIINARRRGFSVGAAADNGFTKMAGSASNLVLAGSRQVITGAVAGDPQAVGWRRLAGGQACDFCKMLEGRGAVYKSGTADFESHSHCGCSAEPAFR